MEEKMVQSRFERLVKLFKEERGHKSYVVIRHKLNHPSQRLLRKVLNMATEQGVLCRRKNGKYAAMPKLHKL